MASVTDFFNKIKVWMKEKSNVNQNENKEESEGDELSELEPSEMSEGSWLYYGLLEMILWGIPVMSFLNLVFINFLFWSFDSETEIRLFGLVFILLEAAVCFEAVSDCTSIYFEVNIGWPFDVIINFVSNLTPTLNAIEDADKISLQFEKFSDKLLSLRQEQPGSFCVASCLFFLLLNIIGRSISDLWILYTLLMFIFTVPGFCVWLVPPCFINKSMKIFHSSHENIDREVEEYLPESNGETLELLNLAGELPSIHREDDEDSNDILLEQMSARTNDTAESSCSKLSFCPDASLMPSHENSLDFLDFDMPSRNSEAKKSDSEESDHSDIHFQTRHFNGDSSDEDEFSKGLEFKHIEKSKRPVEETQVDSSSMSSLMSAANVGRNLISMGANILTSAMKPTAAESKRTDRESSSDTDSFELIAEEDM